MEYAIIDYVKANPILYERRYSSLKYSLLKRDKWNELAKRTGKDPKVLRLRWRSLRNNFAKKLKEKGIHNEDDALGVAPFWQYYNHMKFISSQYENIESEQDISQDSLDGDEGTVDKTGQIGIRSFGLNAYINKHDTSNKSVDPNSNITDDTSHQNTKSKRLLKDVTITEACKEMSLLLQKAKQHIIPPSHNQVFFNAVALQVDQAEMMPMDQMRLQQRVLELITQEIVFSQQRTTFEES